MTLRRLRSGERLAGAGAVALLGLLFADWSGSSSGWAAVGWPLAVLAALVLALVAWLLWATAGPASVAQEVTAGVLATAAATVALAALAIRLTLARPEGGRVGVAAYLGLAALAIVCAGCWRALADERTTGPDSGYVPPPARSAPPAER